MVAIKSFNRLVRKKKHIDLLRKYKIELALQELSYIYLEWSLWGG